MAKAIQAYLVLYNASCLVGWAYALYQGLTVLSGDVWPSLEGVWAVSGPTVLIVQTAMILEIFHAGLGFVRSPVFVTAMQVTSRLWVMLCPAYGDSSSSWTGMMVLSWAAVEVQGTPSTLSALLMKVMPYPIFYARYSLRDPLPDGHRRRARLYVRLTTAGTRGLPFNNPLHHVPVCTGPAFYVYEHGR